MEDNKRKSTIMTSGSPGKVLILFALPIMLGNLFQQLYNMVDTIIVGKFLGETALAAVGASYALTTVFVMIAIGGGTGASVITSQYLGAKQYKDMKTSIYTALITFLFVSILLGLFGFLANERILAALSTPDNVMDMAGRYLAIYFLGLPFLFMYNILASVFNAMGDSRIPLYLLIFSSVLNVVLDLAAVAIFGMGVEGVAIATVFSQGVSAVMAFFILRRRLNHLISDKPVLFDGKMLVSMVRIAIPSIIQQSIISIGMLLVQSVVNGFGSSVLAGYTAAMRVESICIIPMIALGNAVSTFTAQNIGGGKPERVKKGYRVSYGIVIGLAVVLCLILTLFHKSIIDLFLEGEALGLAMETGTNYLSFIAFFFGFIGFKAITDGVLRGAGDVLVFTLANLANLAIRVFVAFRFAPVFGVAAVWYGVPMGWAANYIISLIRYLTGKWSQKKLI